LLNLKQEMAMNVQDLLWGKGPRLHVNEGQALSYQVMDEVLLFLAGHMREGMHTLETGIGVSTLLFAMKRCVHTCIAPLADEAERVRDFAREKTLPLDTVTFRIDTSERVLPGLEGEALDLVLIDGSHGFPVPFIDWYYTADRLKVGGLLVLDDTQLWTVHVLKEFLLKEPEWRIEKEFPPRCAVFRKTRPGSCAKNEFWQPYVTDKTIELLYPGNIDLIRPYLPAGAMDDWEQRERPGSLLNLRRTRDFAERVLRYLHRKL
jgi:hypothetical protein